jgi:hypothetical protein
MAIAPRAAPMPSILKSLCREQRSGNIEGTMLRPLTVQYSTVCACNRARGADRRSPRTDGESNAVPASHTADVSDNLECCRPDRLRRWAQEPTA